MNYNGLNLGFVNGLNVAIIISNNLECVLGSAFYTTAMIFSISNGKIRAKLGYANIYKDVTYDLIPTQKGYMVGYLKFSEGDDTNHKIRIPLLTAMVIIVLNH